MFLYLLKWVLEVAVPPTPRLDELYIPRDELEYIEWLIGRVGSVVIEEPIFHDYGTNLSVYTKDFEDLFFHMDIAIRYLKPHADQEDVIYPTELFSISYVEYRLNVKRDYQDTYELVNILTTKFRLFRQRLAELDDVEALYQARRWARLILDITTVYETLLARTDRNESELTDTF